MVTLDALTWISGPRVDVSPGAVVTIVNECRGPRMLMWTLDRRDIVEVCAERPMLVLAVRLHDGETTTIVCAGEQVGALHSTRLRVLRLPRRGTFVP